MKKLTTEDFIRKSIQVHGEGKFNYENVEYFDANTKVQIKCNKCETIFWQTPYSHSGKKSGCANCHRVKLFSSLRSTKEEFIKRAEKIHGKETFNYENVDYFNSETKVQIKCNKCETIFWQRPDNHTSGKQGCLSCARSNLLVVLTNSKEDFIIKAITIHGYNKFDYSIVKYVNNRTKIDIKCNTCTRIFKQTPDSHVNSRNGCPNCKGRGLNLKKAKNIIDFIRDAQIVHGINKYNYDDAVYFNNITNLKIKCNTCGNSFSQTPSSHICQKSGCPNCFSSKGETFIKKYLDDNNIVYKQQVKFDNCKFKKRLPFDFYIESSNLLLEYNGKQHYEPIDYFGGIENFKVCQKRDQIKRLFAKSNGFTLIEIPYTMSNDQIITTLDFHLNPKESIQNDFSLISNDFFNPRDQRYF